MRLHCLQVTIIEHNPVLYLRGTGIDSESEYVLVVLSLNGIPSDL